MKFLILFLLSSINVYSQEISFTIDDFNFDNSEHLDARKRDELIRETLKKFNVKAMGFVTTKYLSSQLAKEALILWSKEGHILGNHTHSHRNYHKESFADFSQDILRAETELKSYTGFQKVFRFPYLKEGDSREKIDQMRTFLKSNGYKNGAVTIDASDWYINLRLLKKLKEDPKADLTPYRNFYLSHIHERAKYYAALSQSLLGRDVKYTLLLHHNLTTAFFLGDLISMFKKNGWKVVDPKDAYSDKIYESAPKNVPAGESLIWAIAKERGNKTLRYPAESDEYEKPLMDKLGL